MRSLHKHQVKFISKRFKCANVNFTRSTDKLTIANSHRCPLLQPLLFLSVLKPIHLILYCIPFGCRNHWPFRPPLHGKRKWSSNLKVVESPTPVKSNVTLVKTDILCAFLHPYQFIDIKVVNYRQDSFIIFILEYYLIHLL